MKPPCFRLPLVRTLAFATLLAAEIAPLPSRAGTYTWDGGGSNGLWSTGPNWVGGKEPPVNSTDTAVVFAGTTGLSSTLDSNNFMLNALSFDSTAGTFVLGGRSFDFVTNSGGALPTLTQNSASAITVNNALTLGNNLTVGGTGTGTLTLGGVLSGAGSLTMAGLGKATHAE